MSAAPFLSAESLAQGVAAWFAVQVDLQADEDILTRRMRAAIEAAVGPQLAADCKAREDAIAALDRVLRYIRAGHPHGAEATINELDIARHMLARARHK